MGRNPPLYLPNQIPKAFHLSEATPACLVGIKSSILPLDAHRCFSPRGRWPASYTTCEHSTVRAEWADICFRAQGRASVTLKDSADILEQELRRGLNICTLEPGNRYALWRWKSNIYDNRAWIILEDIVGENSLIVMMSSSSELDAAMCRSSKAFVTCRLLLSDFLINAPKRWHPVKVPATVVVAIWLAAWCIPTQNHSCKEDQVRALRLTCGCAWGLA